MESPHQQRHKDNQHRERRIIVLQELPKADWPLLWFPAEPTRLYQATLTDGDGTELTGCGWVYSFLSNDGRENWRATVDGVTFHNLEQAARMAVARASGNPWAFDWTIVKADLAQ